MFKDSKSGTCTAKDSRPVCNETLIGKVKAGLRKFQINNGDDKLAKEIVGNCHYACNREETDSSGKWCYLFYYWLGSTIKGNLGNQHSYTPDKVMKAIYQELQGKCECNNECTNLYDDISSWQTFEEGKKLFDYYYNNSALPGYPDCDKIISGRKYTKLRSDAEEAYDTLDGICDSSNRDKYCTEFRANRDQWNPQKLPEPKCNNERKPKEDEEDEVDKFLPSSNAYKTLEISQKLYKAEALVSIIETYIRSAVHNHTENPNCIDEIASAWYCVNMVISKQSTYSKDERCNFFYYWLGHMLNGKLKNTSKFGEVMNEIYAGLSQFTDEDVCPKVQTNIDITLFNRRKIVFDYWYNYKTMRTQWESPEFHCDSSYKAYFDRALSAYNDVQTDCDNNEKNKHGSYCLKFSGQYGDYNPHILINGKCTNPPKRKEYLVAQDQPQQETPPAEGTSGATTGVVGTCTQTEGKKKEEKKEKKGFRIPRLRFCFSGCKDNNVT
ncbi:KIR protein [Plasmodium coatneyi]|uniref:KIR protein n=1 Tax=Plasmodium coatneyi TaxID=208452 RepID=A0A1B1DWT3_9APIC|nr:KIR protein [Plasmodium coatneyi]ANQ07242.1 KIR protein [Plasmodium coatneyi]